MTQYLTPDGDARRRAANVGDICIRFEKLRPCGSGDE